GQAKEIFRRKRGVADPLLERGVGRQQIEAFALAAAQRYDEGLPQRDVEPLAVTLAGRQALHRVSGRAQRSERGLELVTLGGNLREALEVPQRRPGLAGPEVVLAELVGDLVQPVGVRDAERAGHGAVQLGAAG